MIRAERTGPTTGGTVELYTAMNRVMPASVISS